MLHELSHIVYGPHDGPFHALWDELRNEHETLLMKGYTGEGFLSKGHQLGGGRVPPPSEIRRLARASAETRRTLTKGSGQRVGGPRLRSGEDPRSAIVNAIERRNKIDRGCASGSANAGNLADQATQQTFTTKAEEDDANDRAIAQALFDLLEEDENRKLEGTYATPSHPGGLTWTKQGGLSSSHDVKTPTHGAVEVTEEQQMKWALQESMKATAAASPQKDKKPGLTAVSLSSRRSSNQYENQAVARQVQDAISKPNKRPRPESPEVMTESVVTATTKQEPPKRNLQPQHEIIDLAGALSAAHPPTSVDSWTCEICTYINRLQHLACDVCGIERPASAVARKAAPPRSHLNSLGGDLAPRRTYRASSDIPDRPQPKTLGWACNGCGTYMEHKWWSCALCGRMKDTS